MTKNKDRPKCPMQNCNGRGVAVGTTEYFVCNRCSGIFDDDPDEGGDWHQRDPSRRLERVESQQQRRF